MTENHHSSDVNEDMFQEEPLHTLKREIVSVAKKFTYSILLLKGDKDDAIAALKQWDLWGPLAICFTFSLAIGIQANSQYAYDSFINVFAIFWVGSFFASINCRLLGNKISIFQSISLIGYCMSPLAAIGFIIAILPLSKVVIVRLMLVIVALAWSTASCIAVMSELVSETKKYLCAYPILLFYIFLSWYAIVA